jgi:polyribonucleotide 5'-hydroxyl-kinase
MLILKLISGTAEIFGTEIVTEQLYTFVGTKAAIFTYHGATIFVRGAPSVAYVAGETPMLSYANLHFALEKSRQNAEDSQTKGPRVLILGSEDAGKTTLAKILVGYSVRQGRSPVLVGLDPKEVIILFDRLTDLTEHPFPSRSTDSGMHTKYIGR